MVNLAPAGDAGIVGEANVPHDIDPSLENYCDWWSHSLWPQCSQLQVCLSQIVTGTGR